MRVKKKGQIKIQETAFVLLALMLLFSMAFMFYFRLQATSLVKKGAELRQERAVSLLEKIVGMPELRCSSSLGRTTESSCLDKDKLKIFIHPDMPFKNRYKELWAGLNSVKILEIYPDEEEFEIYRKEGNKSYETYSTFISLCSEEFNGVGWYKCNIGMIVIES